MSSWKSGLVSKKRNKPTQVRYGFSDHRRYRNWKVCSRQAATWDERGTLWGSETVSKPPGSETPLLAKLSPQAAKVVRTAGAISVAKRVMEASTSGR